MIGIMGTLKLEKIEATTDGPTGGRYIVHLWYRDTYRAGIERHEASELTDSKESELSELTEVLGPADAARARSLRPGQQAVIRYGKGLHGRTRLIHRIW